MGCVVVVAGGDGGPENTGGELDQVDNGDRTWAPMHSGTPDSIHLADLGTPWVSQVWLHFESVIPLQTQISSNSLMRMKRIVILPFPFYSVF